MTKLATQVREFHQAFGYPVRTTPQVCEDGEERFRADLIGEEFFESLSAMFSKENLKVQEKIQALWQETRKLIYTEGPIEVDLPKLVDAYGDIDYVVEGARAYHGVDGSPIADEIHRANMSKKNGPKHPETGKQLKPVGWQPPMIEKVLETQGWRQEEGLPTVLPVGALQLFKDLRIAAAQQVLRTQTGGTNSRWAGFVVPFSYEPILENSFVKKWLDEKLTAYGLYWRQRLDDQQLWVEVCLQEPYATPLILFCNTLPQFQALRAVPFPAKYTFITNYHLLLTYLYTYNYVVVGMDLPQHFMVKGIDPKVWILCGQHLIDRMAKRGLKITEFDNKDLLIHETDLLKIKAHIREEHNDCNDKVMMSNLMYIKLLHYIINELIKEPKKDGGSYVVYDLPVDALMGNFTETLQSAFPFGLLTRLQTLNEGDNSWWCKMEGEPGFIEKVIELLEAAMQRLATHL